MPKFTVDGVEYDMVRAGKVTFAEGRAIEKITGTPYSKLVSDDEDASLDFMQALLWVSMRRKNPDVTFDDLDDIEVDMDLSDDEEPAAADPTTGDAAQTDSPTSD